MMNILEQSLIEADSGNIYVIKNTHELYSALGVPYSIGESEATYGNQCISEKPSTYNDKNTEKKDWLLAMTPAFIKSIDGIDNKMKGRVLDAIKRIAKAPLDGHGDTVKPLTGPEQGLWRYRIGDFRLIYRPVNSSSIVEILEFGSRGGIYC